MEKNNLILDLDETLIHTKNISNFNNCDTNAKIIKLPNFTGIIYLRKYLKEFLDFCYKNFMVSFWTSSNSLYCKEVLKIILTKEQYDKTLLILISEEDKIINLKTNIIYKNINSSMKPLNLLFEDNILSLKFNSKNTILIDNDIKIIDFNKKNSLPIESFYNQDEYNTFCKISLFLDSIKESKDIQVENKDFSNIEPTCRLLIVE